MVESEKEEASATSRAKTRFANVSVEISVVVGTARPLIRDLLNLEEDVILTLDRTIEDPVELVVGDRVIARGELEEIGGEGSGQLGVRVTEVISQEPNAS